VNITEVRIKLMAESDDRLRAFCSVTFDDNFVIRDLKIIDGNNGPFVAMPSRKLTTHCSKCRSKNHLRSRYCNQCGARMQRENVAVDHQGRAKLYADIAHPINPECREFIQNIVITAFEEEKERAKQPGYVSNYDDVYESYDSPRTIKVPMPGEKQGIQDEGAEKEGTRDENLRTDSAQSGQRPPHSSKTKSKAKAKVADSGGGSGTSKSDSGPGFDSSDSYDFGSGLFE